jgi:hypothetical protein
MKKLLKSFIPVLALFSLFFTSCEKEKQMQNTADPNAVFSINYKYTAQTPIQVSGSGSGNIANGIVHAVYLLDPYLHGSGICQGGKWSYKVKPNPKTATFAATQDGKTGVVTFIGGSSPATYDITITYTCPDGSSYSATISITM